MATDEQRKTLVLEKPIERGKTNVDELQIRKPMPGEMRGLKMVDVINMDVSTIIKLLPRITAPPITEREAEQMDLADITEAGLMVVGFLDKKKTYLAA